MQTEELKVLWSSIRPVQAHPYRSLRQRSREARLQGFKRRRLLETRWDEHADTSTDMYEALWVARKLLGPKSKNTQIAVLAGLYCGRKPLSPRTVADKFINLDRELESAGVTSTAKIVKYGKASGVLPKVDTSALHGWMKNAMEIHNASLS